MQLDGGLTSDIFMNIWTTSIFSMISAYILSVRCTGIFSIGVRLLDLDLMVVLEMLVAGRIDTMKVPLRETVDILDRTNIPWPCNVP